MGKSTEKWSTFQPAMFDYRRTKKKGPHWESRLRAALLSSFRESLSLRIFHEERLGQNCSTMASHGKSPGMQSPMDLTSNIWIVVWFFLTYS